MHWPPVARWQVVHVCGAARELPQAQPGYAPFAYVDAGWGDMLACADLVVSRAGANAVFELLALRKLQLLVPLPATASRGDQIENAAYARAQGYCQVLRNEALSGDALVRSLEALWTDRAAYARRLDTFESPAAAERVADIIQDLAAERS
jgi:UDP-N-acetylglucosamine--N-acetylmuramyl-(pentapeptide) pyrophosphoryl-undecaprenol N-acetylglucosamine transferase